MKLIMAAEQRRLDMFALQYHGVANIVSGTSLASQVGLNVGTAINSGGGFLEFTHQGKRLYIARLPFRRSVSWNQLNDRDLIFGNREVTIADVRYRVRLMTGGNAPLSIMAGGEWDELFYPICTARPASYDGPVLANLSPAYIGVGISTDPMSTLCQETNRNNTANCIRRGRDTLTYYSGLQKIDAGTLVGWRPVLELVD